MSFRNRTTRFSSTPTVTKTPTVTRTTTQPTVQRTSRPPRSSTFSSTPRTTTPRQTTPRITTVSRTSRPTRVTRPRSVFVSQAPRDDFQRSLTPQPVVREAFAEVPQQVSGQVVQRQGIDLQVATTPQSDIPLSERKLVVREVPVQQRTLAEIRGQPEPETIEDPQMFVVQPRDSVKGQVESEQDFLQRQDPRFFQTVEQQRQADIGVKPKFSQNPTEDKILREIDRVAGGLQSFDRGEFEGRLESAGVDPRSPLGEAVGGFSEFSVGFSEEIVGQGTSLINLASFAGDEITRTGRVNIPFTEIGFDTGQAPRLVAPRREVTVPRTITSEFIGGGIEGLLTGQDAGQLAQQRADDFLLERQGQEVRTAGQLGGFLLPLVVGGAGIVGATIKAPRAFLPVTTRGVSLAGAPTEAVEFTQVARGLTVFGKPVVSKTAQGFVRGAPKADDLLPEIRALGSTPRTAPSFAEGGTRFQQGVNEAVVNKLVQRGDLSKEFGEFFIEAGRVTKTINNAPVNVLRGFGDRPIKKLTVAENKAVKDFFSKGGGGEGLQIKGSFSARTQIRKEGLREIGDIDADLSKFGAESVELSGQKAKELAQKLSQASGRRFTQGTGNRIGKVDLVKGKQRDKVVEFLNELDGEEAIAGLNKQDIVFGVKGTTKSVNVEGINLTRITQEAKRKLASVVSVQKSGTAGVPDDAGKAFRFGAPQGRFEKDAVDLFHETKTIVATLRGLNRTDKLKQSIKLKGVTKAKIDRLEEFADSIPKRFPKNAKGQKINYNNPSATTKQLISFTRSNPLKSIGSKSIKAGSKSSKALTSTGLFAKSLNSALASKPSKSKASVSSGRGSFASASFPSGSLGSGAGVPSNPFDPFSTPTGKSPAGSKPSGTGSKPSGSAPSGSTGTPSISTPTGSGISIGAPTGTLLPFGQRLPRGQLAPFRRGRRSRQGRRLFDIADQPFGKVAVGLGFFVEVGRGQQDDIEQVLGIPDEPLTRQERQARERLGVGGNRRTDPSNFAEGFDFGEFFS